LIETYVFTISATFADVTNTITDVPLVFGGAGAAGGAGGAGTGGAGGSAAVGAPTTANPDITADGNNRLSLSQATNANTGDAVAGQVIGAVSAGASSIDARN